MEDSPRLLAPEQQFRKYGFAICKGVLSLSIAHRVRQATWSYYKTCSLSLPQAVRDLGGDAHQFCYALSDAPAELRLILDSPRFQHKVFALTGWNHYVVYDYYLFFKPPGAEMTPWHRDGDSLPLHGPAITAWIPLTPLTQGITYARETGALCPNESLCEDISSLAELFAKYKAELTTPKFLRPGDILFHNRVVWHHGPANDSSHYRLAISLSLASSDCIAAIDPPGHNLITAKSIRIQSYQRNLAPIPLGASLSRLNSAFYYTNHND